MYKIRIWSCSQLADEPSVPKISGCTVEGKGWTPVPDIPAPAGLALTLGGICSSFEITVDPEPQGNTRLQLEKFCSKIAENCNGAFERLSPLPGEDTFVICGEKNFYPEVPGEKASLALWFAPAGDTAEKRRGLTGILSEVLPFALPGQYGEGKADLAFEENGGLAGFDTFLEKADDPVWHGRLPVKNVYLRDKAPADGKGCGYLAIDLNPACFEYEEWKAALYELLKRLCLLYGAFFGQLINGERQVAAGFWQGIPAELGCACVLGPEYSGLAQDVSKGEKYSEGFIFFKDPDGPYIQSELLSVRKKSFFGRLSGEGRGYLLASDFSCAQTIPGRCFKK